MVATVSKQGGTGISVTHDYKDHAGAIPLPATLSMELGRRISSSSDSHVSLYSPYPFPWRKDGGLRDAFGEEAWEALKLNPGEPYFRFISDGGSTTLR